mgnify:CR=1 FL=1
MDVVSVEVVVMIVQHFWNRKLYLRPVHRMVALSTNDFENVIYFVRAIWNECAGVQIVLNVDQPAISDADRRGYTLAVKIYVLVSHINILVQMREQYQL